MKKYFIYAASALALAACSSDEYIGEVNEAQLGTDNGAIMFSAANSKMTRADLTHTKSADALGNNFVVVGFKGTATAAANTGLVFDHYNVNYKASTANTTTSNTADWEYVNQDQKVKGTDPTEANWTKLAASGVTAQTIKYWDHAATSYDFLAFSMGKGKAGASASDPVTYATPTAVNKANLATAAYTLEGDADQLSECYISDITTIEEENYNTTAVSMKFRHLTSKVRLALFETVPGYVIKDVKFRETLTDSHEAASSTDGILIGADAFNDKGTLTVYFPTTGTANKSNSDYNKAHVKFTAATTGGTASSKTFGAVDYKNAAEDAIAAGTTYLAQSAAAPSYVKPNATGNAGEYVTVLPHENDSKVLSIQIDYTLVATDGSGEEIQVYGARADIPKEYTAWKSGYAYTYKFKISQNTNGHTGTSVDDKGLTAISFDAVVLDDENGVQETITTVATPSFTTYGYIASSNTVSVNADEYATGTDIYATVVDGTTSKAPTALYTVTIEAGAAQGINEASVANAIKNGTRDNDAKTYTVTDANTKKLVVTDATGTTVAAVPTSASTTISVPALKWTAGASGTIYAVEYTSGTNKYYKIVRIQ